jgi:hypothetical protein
MSYLPYPKEKDTPNRKNRKSERSKIFQHNKTVIAKLHKEQRLARKQAALEAEEATEE